MVKFPPILPQHIAPPKYPSPAVFSINVELLTNKLFSQYTAPPDLGALFL
jgi:hypothetical protein